MHAILIDPEAREVREVEIEPTLQSYYKALGCELIEAAQPHGLRGADVVYVDEEGLLPHRRPSYGFMMRPYPFLAGRGLVVGTDDEGGTVAPETTAEEVRALITWREVRTADGEGSR